MTTTIRLYRTYILSTFVPLNTIRRGFNVFYHLSKFTFQGKQLSVFSA